MEKCSLFSYKGLNLTTQPFKYCIPYQLISFQTWPQVANAVVTYWNNLSSVDLLYLFRTGDKHPLSVFCPPWESIPSAFIYQFKWICRSYGCLLTPAPISSVRISGNWGESKKEMLPNFNWPPLGISCLFLADLKSLHIQAYKWYLKLEFHYSSLSQSVFYGQPVVQ